jgi:ferredoxin-NADP reductase
MKNHNILARVAGHVMPTMKKLSFTVSLKDKKLIAKGTKAFTFEKPQSFQYAAGQHVRMTLIDPLQANEKGNSRFLSMASSPIEIDLEFAMRMSDSAFKQTLDKMPIGSKVLIEKLVKSPHGSFALPNDSSRPTVFLVGGIGIVPAFSIIKDAIQRKLSHKIFLFYSNRTSVDTPYLSQLEKLTRLNPNFKLIATMTQADQGWKGETGYIDSTMLSKYLSSLDSPIYYIAGLTEMVRAMKVLLKTIGIKENDIKAEEFSGFTMNHKPSLQIKPSHFLPIAFIILLIILIVFVHIGAGSIINFTSIKQFFWENPILSLVIGFLSLIIMLKIKHKLMKYHTKVKIPKKNRS